LARFSFNHHLKSQLSPIPIIPDGTAAGVQSRSGGAVEPPIAGLAGKLAKTSLTTSVESPSSAVLPAATNLTSTDGGDDNRGEPKKKKPWDAYPNFTVNIQCGKCKNYKSRIGCDGNGKDGEPTTWRCLSEVEHKVRATIKTLLVEADPGKYKSTIRFNKHLNEDGTPIGEVVNLLPAALKANGYTV
jgi:hypothetical protein